MFKGKLIDHIKRHWHWHVLIGIILIASFIHFLSLSSGLLFRADQARDAFHVKEVFERGVGSIKLLGPKIDLAYIKGDVNSRGDTLHIGPFYYYTQLFFAFIFKSFQPWVIALPDALMFILSIPLFYYLSIQFFSRKNSLLITALFAFSFFNLMYSSFNWNPNQLFFWEILLVLSLFKLLKLRDEKRGWWLILTVLSLVIISQLHFVAFVVFTLFTIYFLFFIRCSKISKKFWLTSALLVLVFSLPMIASEIKNNGDNSKRFLVAITREQKENKPFLKKVSKTYDRFGEFFGFNLTSFHEREIGSVERVGGIFFMSSIIFVAFLFFKNKSVVLFKNQKILLSIILLWSICNFVIFFKIYGKLDNMRYFVSISPLVFIMVGIWFSLLEKIKFKMIGVITMLIVTIVLLFFNFQASYSWHDALKGDNKKDEFKYNRNLKLGPHGEMITFSQMEKSFDYIAKQAEVQEKKVCLRNSNYQYNLGFEFIRDVNYPNIILSRFSYADAYSDCLYFIIGRTTKGVKDIDEGVFGNFKIKNSKKIDALTIWEFELKDELKINSKEKGVKTRESETRMRAETWGELLQSPPYKK